MAIDEKSLKNIGEKCQAATLIGPVSFRAEIIPYGIKITGFFKGASYSKTIAFEYFDVYLNHYIIGMYIKDIIHELTRNESHDDQPR